MLLSFPSPAGGHGCQDIQPGRVLLCLSALSTHFFFLEISGFFTGRYVIQGKFKEQNSLKYKIRLRVNFLRFLFSPKLRRLLSLTLVILYSSNKVCP